MAEEEGSSFTESVLLQYLENCSRSTTKQETTFAISDSAHPSILQSFVDLDNNIPINSVSYVMNVNNTKSLICVALFIF